MSPEELQTQNKNQHPEEVEFKAKQSAEISDMTPPAARGFRGWHDYRLWFALSFHRFACMALYQSAIYSSSEFHLFKLFWDLIFSLLVMTTLCWEWRLFGNINSPNLAGHFAFAFSLTFLFDRFFTRPVEIATSSFSGLLGKMLGKAAASVLQALGDFVNNVLHVPVWLQEIFRSPLLLLLFVLLCFILNSERKKGIPALGIILILYSVITFTNPRSGADIWFVLGILFILAGLALQYNDSYSFEFWKAIRNRLGKKEHYRNIAAKGAIIQAAYEDENISDARVRALVAQYFNLEENTSACYRETSRILKELVIREAVFSSELTNRGFIFYINPDIVKKSDILSSIPAYFRAGVIGVVAVAWLLMPLDLFPDSIPVLGIVDDLFICFAGGKIISDLFKGRRISQRNNLRLTDSK